jgi:hypothetical protein
VRVFDEDENRLPRDEAQDREADKEWTEGVLLGLATSHSATPEEGEDRHDHKDDEQDDEQCPQHV